MLLEALKKYDLVDRFEKIVAGFVDGHALAEAHETKAEAVSEIIKRSSEVGDHEKNFEGNAMTRAQNAYNVLQLLAKGEHRIEVKFHKSKCQTHITTQLQMQIQLSIIACLIFIFSDSATIFAYQFSIR